MKFWKDFSKWWPTVVPAKLQDPATWVFHGTVAALIVLAFTAVGLGTYGYAAAVGAYAFREAESIVRGTQQDSPWWDRLGDVLGPAVLGLMVLLLV